MEKRTIRSRHRMKGELKLHDEVWRRVPSLQDAGADDRVFVLSIDADGRATLTFGDGKQGARLPSGTDQITATYRWHRRKLKINAHQ